MWWGEFAPQIRNLLFTYQYCMGSTKTCLMKTYYFVHKLRKTETIKLCIVESMDNLWRSRETVNQHKTQQWHKSWIQRFIRCKHTSMCIREYKWRMSNDNDTEILTPHLDSLPWMCLTWQCSQSGCSSLLLSIQWLWRHEGEILFQYSTCRLSGGYRYLTRIQIMQSLS